MVEEFSIYLKNKPSQLEKVLKCISENKIDIRAFCIVESKEYAVMRAIFDQTELADEVLSQNNFIFNINEVVAIKVEHAPGGLEKIVRVFSDLDINIEYAYQSQSKFSGYASLIIYVKNLENIKKSIMNDPSIRLITVEEL